MQVRLEPTGSTFTVEPGETVLRAAERQGVRIRYGCRHGNCSTCKYFLVDGDVDFGGASPYSLSEAEREDGWALLCCAQPLTDLVIEDSEAGDDRSLPIITPSELEGEVLGSDHLGEGLRSLRVRLDRPLRFYPGQFVELGVPGHPGEWRSYSIASPPEQPTELEFVVKRVEGGAFSGQLDRLAAGTVLPLRGPFGDAYLRPGTNDVLLVGAGSGIAPLLSMLRHAALAGDERRFSLFYGARTRAGIALLAEAEAALRDLRGQVVACLSRPTDACGWDGFVGRVTNALQALLPSAHGLDAYVCGKPEMCDSVTLLLEAKGIADGCVFADRFFATAPQAAVNPSAA